MIRDQMQPCPKCGDTNALYGEQPIGCGRCSWEADFDDWQSRAKIKRVNELESALKSVLSALPSYLSRKDGGPPDDAGVYAIVTKLTVGDVRTAHAALEGKRK